MRHIIIQFIIGIYYSVHYKVTVKEIIPHIIRQIKSRRMTCVGHVACMGEEKKMYKILGGKREGKRPLGRPRHRWENGIRMDPREIGWGGRVWIGFDWLRIGTSGKLL
jgi:hypothetical protein